MVRSRLRPSAVSLVEVQAERGEVVDRGLRHGPPRTDGDYSEAM
jgi:hypothetical protein